MQTAILFGAFFGLLTFLFPIFFDFKVYAELDRKVAYFSLRLFWLIPILSGSIALIGPKLFLCYGKKRKWLELSDIQNEEPMFEISKGFQVYAFHQIYERGTAESDSMAFLLLHLITLRLQRFFHARKRFLKLSDDLLIDETSSRNCVLMEIVTIVNGLVLFIAICKILLEKVNQNGREKQKIRQHH